MNWLHANSINDKQLILPCVFTDQHPWPCLFIFYLFTKSKFANSQVKVHLSTFGKHIPKLRSVFILTATSARKTEKHTFLVYPGVKIPLMLALPILFNHNMLLI